MVDINSSHEFDPESEKEAVAAYAAAVPYGHAPGLLAYYMALQEAKGELTDPVDFMRANYPGRSLFRFILTHPDMDHLRGIKRLHEEIGFTNFWDTENLKDAPDFRGDAEREDWEFYQSLRPNALNYTRGADKFAFGTGGTLINEWDNIEILSPSSDLVQTCNIAEQWNDLSIVLRIHHRGRSVILPGDAEAPAWDAMLGRYGVHLSCDVLKASHHGRDSGFHEAAVKQMAPKSVIVSVGRKPDTDASTKYRYHCGDVVSTRYYGNICMTIDDNGAISWGVDRNYD